jgi:Tol biopolymer transport system component
MLAFNLRYYGGIWTARADGTSATEVIPVREPWLWAEHPAWSPDGRRLAFNAVWIERRPGEEGENDIEHTTIYVAGPDRKSHRLREGLEPVWSPDGRRIAYIGRGYDSIRIMRADGSRPRTLVRKASFPRSLDFAPDGRKLVFQERHVIDGVSSFRLRVVDLEDGAVRTLPVTGNPLAAAWSPNGTRIAYLWEHYWRAGEGAPATQIWTMHPDGSHQRRRYRLTGHRWAQSIAWQRRPSPEATANAAARPASMSGSWPISPAAF